VALQDGLDFKTVSDTDTLYAECCMAYKCLLDYAALAAALWGLY